MLDVISGASSSIHLDDVLVFDLVGLGLTLMDLPPGIIFIVLSEFM